MKKVAIIGGGLAGIAAAIRLAECGDQPILIETRKRLGGRATSLLDPRSNQVIDNCQHVLLGCCTNLIDLYARLGVLEQIEWHDTLYWTRGGPNAHVDRMRANWLPAPLHLTMSFQRMRIFSKSDKSSIARAMWRMIRMGSKGRLAWTNRTFAEFLRECKQPDSIVRSFWNTIIVSACNMDVDRVCASHALQVFQDGFLANRRSYLMGLATVPLGDLYASAIDRIIDAGGDIQLGVSAKSISFDGRRVTGVITEDSMIECAAVIGAVPFDRLDKLVSDTMKRTDQRLRRLNEIQVSPILGVHLYFPQLIMDLPHLVLIDRAVQWLFNKGVDDQGRQHVHAVISAAEDWMEMNEAEIVPRVLADVHHALPKSIGLQPIESRAIKEKRATFAAIPGIDAIRSTTQPSYIGGGGIENLFLAGDWTDTGWPATMEGAVRSGYAAARAIAGTQHVPEIPDIPSSILSRILGLK